MGGYRETSRDEKIKREIEKRKDRNTYKEMEKE